MEKKERCKDADVVNAIIARYSTEARQTGKLLAAFVVVLSIFMSEGVIVPSFVLGMLYIVFEYLYSISITLLNKSVLRKYFVSAEDGYSRVEGKDAHKVSRRIANYGSIQMIINAIILIISIFCLI